MAGLIVALAGERGSSGEAGSGNPRTGAPAHQRTLPWTLFLSCMVLAALPDLDWIYPPLHRGPTHSLGAVVLVALGTAGVTRWATGSVHWRAVLLCSVAYASHILMDWLGRDPTLNPGVMVLWPLNDTLYLSGWDLFRSTQSFRPLSSPQFEQNVLTLLQEIAIFGPILLLLLWRRRR